MITETGERITGGNQVAFWTGSPDSRSKRLGIFLECRECPKVGAGEYAVLMVPGETRGGNFIMKEIATRPKNIIGKHEGQYV